ncbi:YigZ family protein [Ornithobacterium rhinotracheale]|uniref:YigZ family protein n=1 Tax=Ornithobacterium rhinotracheale TaxID=28251 RepID=A0A410JRR3_ORNRH|nr:YigZ family protein [Ornithobacterium rhinotracheale]QAR30814.1 YigZ family protein [Ornithobacterium rhinotracheale]
MIFECKSIKNPIENIITKEKGSKFLGYAYPVQDEEEVKQILGELRQKYPDATHHCYAYRLGFEGEVYRANDDGEPNGTAGLPIYNQLLSRELTYCLVVSIRYFRGIKLGVSGLIKAYKESAELTLNEAEIRIIEKMKDVSVKFPYTSQGVVMRNVEKFQAQILKQKYLADCTLDLRLSLKKYQSFVNSFEPFNEILITSQVD